jgi:HD-GYP domain-containing protein (c-di-GMP phosphodiesterase class II)
VINIHRLVLRRLLLAWLVISLVLGVVVHLVEVDRMEKAIVMVANTKMQELTLGDLLDLPPEKNSQDELQLRSASFLQKNFIVIEVFAADGQRVARITNPAQADLQAQWLRSLERLPRDQTRHIHRLEREGETLVEMTFPVHQSGLLRGHIAAIFRLEPMVQQMLFGGMERRLLLVLLIVTGTTIALYPVIIQLNRSLWQSARKILQGNLETVSVLSAAIAMRDIETGEHNARVTLYALALAKAVELEEALMQGLILGALLHDVGKIGIPDQILHKSERLSAEEQETMRQHVAHGVRIISGSAWLHQAREVIEFHHEKYDGSGYLKGLRGNEIPEVARIFAIADVFDALVSSRPYKPPLSVSEARQMILNDADTHFDPDFVAVFANMAERCHKAVQGKDSEALIAEIHRQASPYFLEYVPKPEA